MKTLIGLGLLAVSLGACGVREEGSMDELDEGLAASLDTLAISTEGEGNTVELTFPFGDSYAGFWLDDADPVRVLRIALGEIYYHHEWFEDASENAGTDGLNCYRGAGSVFMRQHGLGLRKDAEAELTESYFEITAANGILMSKYYDSNGDLEPESSYTGTYRKVFEGLSSGEIQECT